MTSGRSGGCARGRARARTRRRSTSPGPAYKCSCPSRKFPCKHALALLLLWAGGDVAAGRAAGLGERVAGVALGARAARPAPGEPTRDPEAAARRAAAREERVAAGVEDLRRWLRDAVRGGLGAGRLRSWEEWDAFAARLVDAQAPGAASRLRSLGGVAAGRPGRLAGAAALGARAAAPAVRGARAGRRRGARRRARAAGLQRRAGGGAGRAARERPLDGARAGRDRAGAAARAAHVAVGRRDRAARRCCWTSRRRARRWSRGRRPGWRSRARWPSIRARRRCGRWWRRGRRRWSPRPGASAAAARRRRCARWPRRVAANPWLDEWPVALAAAVVGRARRGAVDGRVPRRLAPARRLARRALARARLLRRAPGLPLRALERRGAGAVGRGRRRADGARCEGQTLVARVRRARVEDAGGIARAWVRAWQVAYRGLVPDEVLDALDVDERRALWRERLEGGDCTFVVEDLGIAGYCRVVPPAEIASLYVLPERRHGGVGSALLAAGARRAALARRPRDAVGLHRQPPGARVLRPLRVHARRRRARRRGHRADGDPAAGGAVTRGCPPVPWGDIAATPES